MSNEEVSPFDDRWYIDPYTGEVLDKLHSDISYLQPLDLSLITSKVKFEEVVKERRKRYMKLWISPLLLDVVVERGLTIPAISILCVLGQRIGYNTMVYTTMKDVVQESGYVRQTVSSAITELKEKGYIREVGNKLEEKDSRFLLINPLYFFIGYYPHRQNLVRDWVMGK